MTYDEITKEFGSSPFRKRMMENLPKRCACCGNADNIEYHHILPRANGGDNRLSNIVPVCYGCHAKIHEKTLRKDHRRRENANKTKRTPEMEIAFKEYASDKGVPLEQVLTVTGLKKSVFYRLYNEWCKENGVAQRKEIPKRKSKKKVLCVETDVVFESLEDAIDQTCLEIIRGALTNPTKTAGGYHWKYVDEVSI